MAEIRYRVYIGSMLIASSVLVLAVIFASMFTSLQGRLFEETSDRLRATAVLGADGIDTDDLRALVSRVSPSLDEKSSLEVEKTPEYIRVSAYLNRIRSTNPTLIRYVYILSPGEVPERARFVVDADVLALRAEILNTGKSSDEISGFNLEYDISGQRETIASLMQKTPQVGSSFVRDEAYGVNSLMGIAPIFDRETGAFMGCLGIDISDGNYSAFLWSVFLPVIAIAVLMLAFILAGSFALSWRISKPIKELTDAVRRFGESDLASRSALTTNIKELYDLKTNYNGMADKIQSYQEHLIELNAAMERFVPDAFLTFLSKKSIVDVRLGDQIQKDMTVMFSDIRGFTAISENLTPKQTFNFLNEYLSRIAPIIRRHGGFIDKYLGDGVMAIFPGRVDDAVRCALDMIVEIRKFNGEREKAGLQPIMTGTGIHCGTLMMGTIGEEKRMQTTVIADSVNVACRLESMTKETGTRLLVTREIYNRLEELDSFMTRYVGPIQFKGKDEKIGVFEVYDQDPAECRELKAVSRKDFEHAVSLLGEGKFAPARKILERVVAANPSDRAALWRLDQCRARRVSEE